MSSVTDPEAIISGFVSGIHPAFVITVANTAFSASLFTLFVVLLALSTKESRRRVIFRLNVFAICIVLTMGIVIGFCNGKIVVGRLYWMPPSVPIAAVAFTVFPPLLCDSILLSRLFALYPLRSTSSATLLKILAFPFCVKSARVVVLTLFLNDYVRSATTAPGLLWGEDATWFRNPRLIAEWTLQIADNSLFLYNLYVRAGSVTRQGGMTARIRQVFYISAANFVLPLIFSIVLIILFATPRLLAIGELLWLINGYVTALGVLCATLWFSGSEWARIRNEPSSSNIFSFKPTLQRECDRKHGCEIAVVGERFVTPDIVGIDFARGGLQSSPPTDGRE
ncbi:hypothetical protein F5J12DRAFT_891034 [Pisolithus orientalis]|uniref:uncharacterized protein n=1 Tax=Pisolithus orientalis TaxID=936130 RepID=UPI0022249DA2|nr:uncharacterized protein F5J12DRAFT_891034 [Pisolithus orientalis]KAI6012715.1 hypothetical protein F5J12DRAFT_891034 [Pisolithus orientalis]